MRGIPVYGPDARALRVSAGLSERAAAKALMASGVRTGKLEAVRMHVKRMEGPEVLRLIPAPVVSVLAQAYGSTVSAFDVRLNGTSLACVCASCGSTEMASPAEFSERGA